MDKNNENQCFKIPEILEKCQPLIGKEKNDCIRKVKYLLQICSDKENNRKKLFASILAVS